MSEDTNIQEEVNEGITTEQLIMDIQLLGNVVQQHDQSVFQIIASLNAIQFLLIENKVCTEEDLATATQNEAKALQEKIMAMVNDKQEQESKE